MGLSQLFVVISGIGSYIRVLPKVIMGLPACTCAPGTDKINIYIQFFVVVKECDGICHLGCNECLEFIAI